MPLDAITVKIQTAADRADILPGDVGVMVTWPSERSESGTACIAIAIKRSDAIGQLCAERFALSMANWEYPIPSPLPEGEALQALKDAHRALMTEMTPVIERKVTEALSHAA